ncbi:MAG: hypothetical protein JWN42_886 [Candidatus Angelobacter sp.]|nr:hypothetical protein [Candidatus Angelobacter sp.]
MSDGIHVHSESQLPAASPILLCHSLRVADDDEIPDLDRHVELSTSVDRTTSL